MIVFRKIILQALFVGLISGAIITGVQHIEVIPTIVEAEVYENQAGLVAEHHHSESSDHLHTNPESSTSDIGRTAYTLLANILVAIGFSLLLLVCFLFVSKRDYKVLWYNGLLWGLAGFVVFNFAPAIGLPPELPGMEAAPLENRQEWWFLTVILTGTGLGLAVFTKAIWGRVLGIVLLLIPHIIGAPQPEHHASDVPKELQDHFVLVSLITSAVFWLILGSLNAYFYRNFRTKLQA